MFGKSVIFRTLQSLRLKKMRLTKYTVFIPKGCYEVLNKVINEKALNKLKTYANASHYCCHCSRPRGALRFSKWSRNINGQNVTICIFVLDWINDLLVSTFLGVTAKKKKSYTVMNSGQVFFFFLFPQFLGAKSRRKLGNCPKPQSPWCTFSSLIIFILTL